MALPTEWMEANVSRIVRRNSADFVCRASLDLMLAPPGGSRKQHRLEDLYGRLGKSSPVNLVLQQVAAAEA